MAERHTEKKVYTTGTHKQKEKSTLRQLKNQTCYNWRFYFLFFLGPTPVSAGLSLVPCNVGTLCAPDCTCCVTNKLDWIELNTLIS